MEKNGIFLFTGENHFALLQKKKQWQDSFREKHGDENLLILEAKNLSQRDLFDEVAAAPFIASNRLVVLDAIPAWPKEDIERLFTVRHPNTIVLFCDPKPDKRLGSTKLLLDKAALEEFAPLLGAALEKWVRDTVTSQGIQIAPEAVKKLIASVGSDQFMLFSELMKLCTYVGEESIESHHVDAPTLLSTEQQVWTLLDLIGAAKTKDALSYLERLYRQGEQAQGLWAILLWMMSGLLPVYDAVQSGVRNPAQIAKQYGVKFGAAKSLIPLVSRLSFDAVAEIVQRASSTDFALKSSAMKATQEAPEELKATIDRLVVLCCKAH